MSGWKLPENSPKISEEITKMRADYRKIGIPVILDESLNLLLLTAKIKSPEKILEIGTATGMSGACLLNEVQGAKLYTIEFEEDHYREAKENFKKFGVFGRVKQYLGDAGEIIRFLDGKFDFIFLDGPKARYYDYLPDITRLLADSGVLFADNVLFRGLVESEKPPHGDMTIVRNMRAFITELCENKNFITTVLRVGDGILISQKRG